MLDVTRTKGPSCGRGFVSGSQHHCFHATSHLACALDSTAESRQAPHRSSVHGFGRHHEGDVLEFHLHSLHQPQDGKGGPAFHLAWGGAGGREASDWQAGPGCAVPKSGLLQSPLCHLQTVLPLLLCAQATPAITEPTQDCSWKTSQDVFLGFSFLTPTIQASSRVH